MSTLLKNYPENNPSFHYRTNNGEYLNPYSKKNAIYFRDTIKQFCPHQRFVDHRPYTYRNFPKAPYYFNYFNTPTEKDSFVPCYKNYAKREICPLVKREDLEKFLKSDDKLIKHRRPCISCSKINQGNYGRNYYTINQKSFPFINGNFTGTNFRITNGFKTPSQMRNTGRIKYKLKDYDTYDNYNNYNNYDNYQTNKEFNKEYNENEKVDIKNENEDIKNENENTIKDNNNKTISNELGNISKYKRRFRKTQIFNNYKPFMVDDFKEYADYE